MTPLGYNSYVTNMPNGDKAVVDINKLRDYCLSEEHPRGKHKARIFAAALGWSGDDAEHFRELLLNAAGTGDAAVGEKDEFGQRHIIDFVAEGSKGTATIRSAWIVREEEDVPRLVTCWVL